MPRSQPSVSSWFWGLFERAFWSNRHTLNSQTCFLCSGSGKHGRRNFFIVVRLGHPLRFLVGASCGSSAAKKTAETFLPSILSCQYQQIIKCVQPLVILVMSNKDGFAMATTQSTSHERSFMRNVFYWNKSLLAVPSLSKPVEELFNVHSGTTM